MSSHVSDNHRSSDSNLKITNGWSIVLKDQQVTKYEIMAHNIFYQILMKKNEWARPLLTLNKRLYNRSCDVLLTPS